MSGLNPDTYPVCDSEDPNGSFMQAVAFVRGKWERGEDIPFSFAGPVFDYAGNIRPGYLNIQGRDVALKALGRLA